MAKAILVCTGGARFYRTPQHTLEYGLLDDDILASVNASEPADVSVALSLREKATEYALRDEN